MNDIPALVQIMAWRRPGDKPLSGPMMVRLATHICVTRPQWVKYVYWCKMIVIDRLSFWEYVQCFCLFSLVLSLFCFPFCIVTLGTAVRFYIYLYVSMCIRSGAHKHAWVSVCHTCNIFIPLFWISVLDIFHVRFIVATVTMYVCMSIKNIIIQFDLMRNNSIKRPTMCLLAYSTFFNVPGLHISTVFLHRRMKEPIKQWYFLWPTLQL